MNKEFIPYEQALALKELGFDEPCFGFYNHQGQLILMTQEDENSIQVYKNSYVKLGKQYAAPLYQQAFRWFRDKYSIDTWIYPNLNGLYSVSMVRRGVGLGKVSQYDTYKEAELECLEKLIEIIKSK